MSPTRAATAWLLLLAAFAYAAAWLAGAGAQFRQTRPQVTLAPDEPDVVARGQLLYRQHCAACHGADLEGQPDWRRRLPNGRLPAPPHDASGHTWHHPDAQLFALTKLGPAAATGLAYESDMPAYGGILSDDDIVAVLSYIKSRWPADIRQRHDQMNARSRQ